MHPSGRELQRFADGELGERAQSRLANHLADCPGCRRSVTFSRSLRQTIQSLRADTPPASLIERVIAERESGVRAILPNVARTSGAYRRRRLVWIVGAGAAAAALFLAPVLYEAPNEGAITLATTDSLLAPGYFGAFVSASNVFAAQTAPTRRELPPVELTGARLRATRLEYAKLLTLPDGETRALGRSSLVVTLARIEDRDAWRLIQLWRSADTTQAETLHVDRRSLRLLGRVVRVAPYGRYRGITVRQRMNGDSLVGWMNTDEGLGRPIARRLPPAFSPYVSDAMAPLALLGAPLTSTWTGELSLLGWAVRSNDVFAAVTLTVEGEERITVPAGTFDCWRIALGVFDTQKTYWVRKSDGMGIRTRDATSNPRGITDFVLVRE
jgi:hypothetical protein